MPISITDSTIDAIARLSGRWAVPIGFTHIPENDLIFVIDEVYETQGLLSAEGTITGPFSTGTFGYGQYLQAIGSISGTYRPPLVQAGLLEASAKIYPQPGTVEDPAIVMTYYRNNVVGWSKIGDVRILVDGSNEAGYSPLPGVISGYIYQILAFRDKLPVAYGASGVYLMIPVSQPFATFGFKKLGHQGVYQQGCVCGSETKHFFISTEKEICVVESKVDQERPMVQVLGFSEFINELSPANQTVVMHYDALEDRVYISSALGGLVISAQGIGGGYALLSGATGNYFTAPSALVQPAQGIITDTLDMQHRGIKTIHSVQVGANTDVHLYVAIDYRYDKAEAFRTSNWVLCNKEGVAFIVAAGVEFRIRVKNLLHDDFQIDYLNIKFKYTDKRFHRGPVSDNVIGG